MSESKGRTLLLTAGLLLSACSAGTNGNGSNSAPAPTSPPLSRTAPPTDAVATPEPRRGCTPSKQVPPPGYTTFAESHPTDFDGDGRADGVYFKVGSPGDLFVVPTTGEGAGVHVATAKPYHRMGGIDPDGDSDQEMFIRVAHPDGAMVQVLTFANCRVSFALNSQGQPYQFRVARAAQTGDGVGCVDVNSDGKQDLVGLHYERDMASVRWTRTIVRLDGQRAINGPSDGGTFRSPQDDGRIALLAEATCGDQAVFLG